MEATLTKAVSSDNITDEEKTRKLAELESVHQKQEEVLVAQIESQSAMEMERVGREIDEKMLKEINLCGTDTVKEVGNDICMLLCCKQFHSIIMTFQC